ncbi:MAG: hypothetical protein MRJ96_07575 [Nitrospirales bacterium]|nr:hypothetical protein [Nitrospira sp.]MDR4501292.1 hypothetical protein [Nitrospirales bacterium]
MKLKYIVITMSLILIASGCAKLEKYLSHKKPDATLEQCEVLTKQDYWANFTAKLCQSFTLFCNSRQVDLRVTHRAEIDLGKYKTIAFTKIEGDYGDMFATAYKEQLQKKSQLKVLDRTQLDNLKSELGNNDDLFDPKNRPELGKLLPAGVIVTGRITSNYKEPEELSKSEIPCHKSKEEMCTLNTRNGSATMKGTLNVVSVETGENLKSKRLHRTQQDTSTALDPAIPEPIDEETLQEENLTGLVSDMTKATVNWTELRKVVLFVDSDIPKLDRGILEVKSGREENAERIFAKALQEAEAQPQVDIKALSAARFDLAVLKAYLGKHEEAEKLLSKVIDDTLDTFPAPVMRKINDCLKKERREAGDGA